MWKAIVLVMSAFGFSLIGLLIQWPHPSADRAQGAFIGAILGFIVGYLSIFVAIAADRRDSGSVRPPAPSSQFTRDP
jgi:hypothetical protein